MSTPVIGRDCKVTVGDGLPLSLTGFPIKWHDANGERFVFLFPLGKRGFVKSNLAVSPWKFRPMEKITFTASYDVDMEAIEDAFAQEAFKRQKNDPPYRAERTLEE